MGPSTAFAPVGQLGPAAMLSPASVYAPSRQPVFPQSMLKVAAENVEHWLSISEDDRQEKRRSRRCSTKGRVVLFVDVYSVFPHVRKGRSRADCNPTLSDSRLDGGGSCGGWHPLRLRRLRSLPSLRYFGETTGVMSTASHGAPV